MKKYLVQSTVYIDNDHGCEMEAEGFHILGEVSFEDNSIIEKLNEYPKWVENDPKYKDETDIFKKEYYDDKSVLFERYLRKNRKTFGEDFIDSILNWWDNYKKSGFIDGNIQYMFYEYFPKTSPFYPDYGRFTKKEATVKFSRIECLFYQVRKRYFEIKRQKLIKEYPAFQYPEVEKYINKDVEINTETRFYYVDLEINKLF